MTCCFGLGLAGCDGNDADSSGSTTDSQDQGTDSEDSDSAEPGDSPSDSAPDSGHEDTAEPPWPWAHLDPYVEPTVQVSPLPLEPGGQATVRYEGDLASSDSLVLHHGFNGWNQVQGLDDMVEASNGSDRYWYRQSEMTAAKGGFEVTIDLPSDGRALHMVFFDPEEDSWDNNGEQDYHQSFELPYIGPYLTWSAQAQPETGVVVNFETSLPCLGVVEYGTDEQLGTAVTGNDLGTVHHVVLSGLQPATTYFYKLWDAAGRSSQTYQFTTAELDDEQFSFLVMSDMQDAGEDSDNSWAEVAEHVASSHGEASFALVPGDMSSEDSPGHWWTFFDRGRPLLSWLPLLPAVGNHDTPGTGSSSDTSSFERYFTVPGGGDDHTYYSLDYGHSHFLGLNSEVHEDWASDGDQLLFATEDLLGLLDGGQRQPSWVFCFWHVPPYNAGVRHYREQYSFRPLTDIFQGYVDWVFSGHEHLFQRMEPMAPDAEFAGSGSYGIGPEDGVGYIVTPPAGNWPNDEIVAEDSKDAHYRGYLAAPDVGKGAEVESELGYLWVQLDGDAITIRTWGMGTVPEPKEAWIRDELSYVR